MADMLSMSAFDAFKKIELAKARIETLERELRFHILMMSEDDFREYYHQTEQLLGSRGIEEESQDPAFADRLAEVAQEFKEEIEPHDPLCGLEGIPCPNCRPPGWKLPRGRNIP